MDLYPEVRVLVHILLSRDVNSASLVKQLRKMISVVLDKLSSAHHIEDTIDKNKSMELG